MVTFEILPRLYKAGENVTFDYKCFRVHEKHGLTDEKLDALAAPYESGDYASKDGKVYNAADTQRVTSMSRRKGVKPTAIYREALDLYLATV